MSGNGVCQHCKKPKPVNMYAYCDNCARIKFDIIFKGIDETIQAQSAGIANSWFEKLEPGESLTVTKIKD